MNPHAAQQPSELVLASASPRRAALLRQIEVPFRVCAPAVNETRRGGEPPPHYVRRMALAKARAVAADMPVLAADTVVVLDDRVFGKPVDREAGLAMLGALSGREHDVLTAVAIRSCEREDTCLVQARVALRRIDADEAAAYWATGEPADKAGGYGIQGIGGMFVRCIRGSYSAVVGLPLAETELLLRSAGIDTWRWRYAHRALPGVVAASAVADAAASAD